MNQSCDSWCEVANAISAIVTALFTAGLFFVALIQFKNLIRANSLKTILDLESELNQRKSRIDDITSKIRTAEKDANIDVIDIYNDDLEAAQESYFNALDRLCYCVLKGYLEDRDWKSEYSDLLKETVRSNESSFGIGTYYKNIKKLYEKWVNE